MSQNTSQDERGNVPDISAVAARKYFFAFLGFFTLLWVVLPSLLHPAYRPDVIELMIAGKEWVLSTRKHPMLPAWFLEILNMLTGRAYATPFIASQICVFITLYCVWSLARCVLSERLALIGTFAMLPFWFFTIESIKYNQNTPLIALWAVTILFVFRAFQTNKILYWVMAGISLGLAFNSKYSAVFLVVSILVYMAREPRIRTLWKSPGPYITTLIAFLIFLPQLIWMYGDDFSTLGYAGTQPKASSFLFHFLYPLEFLVLELFYLILPLAVLIPAIGIRWKLRKIENGTENESQRFLFYCMMIPMSIHVVISAVMKIDILGDYAAAFWSFIGVYMLLRFQVNENPTVFSRSVRNLIIAQSLMVALFATQSLAGPYITGKHSRFHFPMREIGVVCEKVWNERYSEPCPFITGDWWLAGNAACSITERPRVHFYYKNIEEYYEMRPSGPWSEDADVNEQGGIILWEITPIWDDEYELESNSERLSIYVPEYVQRKFPRAEILPEEFVIPFKTGADVPPLRFGIATLSPKSADNAE